MILYEYEGKRILFEGGVNIPVSQLLDSPQQDIVVKSPLVLKAQVLSGKRAAAGGIKIVDRVEGTGDSLKALFATTINKEKVEKVLVEEKIDYEREFYLSISYDTDSRSPILTISSEGGTGIEERKVNKYQVSSIKYQAGEEAVKMENSEIPQDLVNKLIKLFFDNDMLLLEINPLVKVRSSATDPLTHRPTDSTGRWLALDAKIKLDDDANSRHEGWNFTQRLPGGRTPTQNEIEAKLIDQGDYRGTAGSAYFDLDGDIAILSSGGGVSLTAMDALINVGGKPANFTEYSGNPPKEKVTKLTKIVLNKPNIHGLWVVGTVAANFTDIYETLSGLIEGLSEAQNELKTSFNFPIVIRRGGPRSKEAFEMLKGIKDFNLILQGEETSISESAAIMAQKAKEFSSRLDRSNNTLRPSETHGEAQ